jgi:hypothetical protein
MERMDLAFRNVGVWERESVGVWEAPLSTGEQCISWSHEQFSGTPPAHVGRWAAVVTVDAKVLLCFGLLPLLRDIRLLSSGVQLGRKLL